MSQGKYSPNLPKGKVHCFNCYGKEPVPYVGPYDEKTMFDHYDDEGFDSYGYSAFDANGEYVGVGNGVDRNGYTEDEYLVMDPETFANL
jgi:hypothetical protein